MSGEQVTQFDKYYVQGSRGAGSLGTVYRTRDLGLNRLVALKVMHPHLARQPHFYERFMAEMQQMARLDHPHIIKIFDFATSRDPLYFVMPYYERNLRVHLGRQVEKRVSAEETAVIGTQIAQALHYAHEKNIVHGNVKPENILLSTAKNLASGEDEIQAVLSDFGLANLLQDDSEQATPTFTGAWEYMAPEFVNVAAPSPQSDIYALGVVLYELLTGKPPFEINNLQDALEKHSNHPIPTDPLAEVSARLRETIIQALDKDPNGRFSSALDMAHGLQGVRRLALNVGQQSTARDETLFGRAGDEERAGEQGIGGSETISAEVVGGDHISIRQMPTKAFPLKKEKAIVRIGRGQGNDIVLPSTKVMDQHATLKRTVEGWEVRDLESDNGVYLDDNRLLPDQEELWKPHQTLRIGPYTLELNASNGSLNLDSSEIVAWVEPSAVLNELEPGQEYVIRLQMQNLGNSREYAQVQVNDLDLAWYRAPQDGVPLAPNEQKAVVIYFTIPVNQTAGGYPYELQINSLLSSQEPLKIRGQLNVEKKGNFTFDIHPQTIINKGSCQVTIHNNGNVMSYYIIKNKVNDSSSVQTTRFGVLPQNIKRLGGTTSNRKNRSLPNIGQVVNTPGVSILRRYVPSLANNPITKSYRQSQNYLRRGQQVKRDASRFAGTWPNRSERRKAQFANALLQQVEIPPGESSQVEFLVETGRRPFQGIDKFQTIQLEIEDGTTKATQSSEIKLTTTPRVQKIHWGIKAIVWILGLVLLIGICRWGIIPAFMQVDTALSLGICPVSTPSEPSDLDGDGLSTTEELRRGLNPENNDTDGDGLLDGVDPHPHEPDEDANNVLDAIDAAPTRVPNASGADNAIATVNATPIANLISWGFSSDGRQHYNIGDDANDRTVKASFTLTVPPEPFEAVGQIQSVAIIFTENSTRRTGDIIGLGNFYIQAQLDQRPFGAAVPLLNLSSDAQRWQATLDSATLALLAQNEQVDFLLFSENPSNLNGVQDQIFLYTIASSNRAQWPVLLVNSYPE